MNRRLIVALLTGLLGLLAVAPIADARAVRIVPVKMKTDLSTTPGIAELRGRIVFEKYYTTIQLYINDICPADDYGAYADIGVYDYPQGKSKTISDTGGCTKGGKTYNLKYKNSSKWSVTAIHILLRERDAGNYGEPDGVEWNQKTFYRPVK